MAVFCPAVESDHVMLNGPHLDVITCKGDCLGHSQSVIKPVVFAVKRG